MHLFQLINICLPGFLGWNSWNLGCLPIQPKDPPPGITDLRSPEPACAPQSDPVLSHLWCCWEQTGHPRRNSEGTSGLSSPPSCDPLLVFPKGTVSCWIERTVWRVLCVYPTVEQIWFLVWWHTLSPYAHCIYGHRKRAYIPAVISGQLQRCDFTGSLTLW